MRCYSFDEEERVRLQELVRDWTASGLLAREQGTQLEADLKTGLRRTGLMLRLGLGIFTTLAVAAAVALFFVTLAVRDDWILGILAMLLGAGCFAAAGRLVAAFRLYRHGIEEGLVVASVVLCGAGAAILSNAAFGSSHDLLMRTVGLGTCAGVSALAYARFGFRYAAVGSLFLTAFIPLDLPVLQLPAERMSAALVCACGLAAAQRMRSSAASEVAADDAAVLGAAALAGAYVALNLHLGVDLFTSVVRGIPPWFLWTTYLLTWAIPGIGLWRGIASRDRWMIDAGLVLAVVTLVTNKAYLGWPRQTWDPMLFGVLMTGVALGARRWLDAGPAGERGGFSSARILRSDGDTISLLGIASVAVQPQEHAPAGEQPSQFGGGRSGGAGGGAEF